MCANRFHLINNDISIKLIDDMASHAVCRDPIPELFGEFTIMLAPGTWIVPTGDW
jgi:hypothetical protein